jgi:hypothetical protein
LLHGAQPLRRRISSGDGSPPLQVHELPLLHIEQRSDALQSNPRNYNLRYQLYLLLLKPDVGS